MPIARAGDIARRVTRILDAEPGGLDTFSPEFVPVILAADVSRPRNREGLTGQTALASGAGPPAFPSIVGLGVVNGRLDADEYVLIDSFGIIAFDVALEIRLLLATGMAGASSVSPSYGDRLYGAVAPFVINAANTAVANAPVVDLLGGPLRIPLNAWVTFPLGVVLRAADHFPTGSSRINVTPSTSNAGISVWFRWKVEKDVR